MQFLRVYLLIKNQIVLEMNVEDPASTQLGLQDETAHGVLTQVESESPALCRSSGVEDPQSSQLVLQEETALNTPTEIESESPTLCCSPGVEDPAGTQLGLQDESAHGISAWAQFESPTLCHPPDVKDLESTQLVSQDETLLSTLTEIDSASPARCLSPSVASDASGTTIELPRKQKFMLKHVRSLCEVATEFLEHMAPDQGTVEGDIRNVEQVQNARSAYRDEYNDYEEWFSLYLRHFKSATQDYIHSGLLHWKLFGNDDADEPETGLSLVVQLTNLVLFTKEMMTARREERWVLYMLRQMDTTFPSQFMYSIDHYNPSLATGDSALLAQTSRLALELRTQLAILVLQKSINRHAPRPDDILEEIFGCIHATQPECHDAVRGWDIPELGGDGNPLPLKLHHLVTRRVKKMQTFVRPTIAMIKGKASIDIEGLMEKYPWKATLVYMLNWVRLRHREIDDGIEYFGGAAAIQQNIRCTLQRHDVDEKTKTSSLSSKRRGRSRAYDPTEPVDPNVLRAWDARERADRASDIVHPTMQINENCSARDSASEGSWKQMKAEENGGETAGEDGGIPFHEHSLMEDTDDLGDQRIEEIENEMAEMEAWGPPTDSLGLVRAPKRQRYASLFDRQGNAQRIEFGDGFDNS